ncbi:MAG: TIGR02996 domain-containing protein, partial [Zavarzinella sp.]|nr:TIGR02996 domain-containing protein [Zavarzinella sp.]
WLEENGQPERAEFIRVQCELARCESPALRRREAELLAAHHDTLAGPLAAPHLRFRFERGFPIGFGHTGLFERRSRSRSGGPAVISLLQFFPDRTLALATATESPALVRRFIQEHPPSARAAYTFSAMNDSATLRIYSPNWISGHEYSAVLKAAWLRLDRPNFVGSLHVGRYTHLPITDVDSFPET